MTSIEAVGEAPILNSEVFAPPESTNECPSVPHSLDSSPGMARLQEHEAFLRASLPNLRALDQKPPLKMHLEKVLHFIANIEYSFERDSLYLTCIEMIAPYQPTLVEELVDKIEDSKTQLKGLILLAKYQEAEQAKRTLQKCPALFAPFSSGDFFEWIDKHFEKHSPLLNPFYYQLHEHIRHSMRYYPAFDRLLCLAQVELRLGAVNYQETIEKAHQAAAQSTSTIYPEQYLMLLECEAQAESPYCHETLSHLLDISVNHWNAGDLLGRLLQLSASYPILKPSFEMVLDQASQVNRDYTLFRIITYIAPYDLQAAEKFMEKMNYQHRALTVLNLEKFLKNPPLNPLELQEFLNEQLSVPVLSLISERFGPETTLSMIDRAIEAMRPQSDETINQEVKFGKEVFTHYLASAFGVDHSYPSSSFPRPGEHAKVLSIDPFYFEDFVFPLCKWGHPSGEALLSHMYETYDDEGYKAESMVKAELQLRINQWNASHGDGPV
ncbi:MAG: hypothetical protein KDK64_00600 [Chlamydiia bacterium]|nr:hypothetical protein [Chlamydiia bacterium]